jgi:hypothetical protein
LYSGKSDPYEGHTLVRNGQKLSTFYNRGGLRILVNVLVNSLKTNWWEDSNEEDDNNSSSSEVPDTVKLISPLVPVSLIYDPLSANLLTLLLSLYSPSVLSSEIVNSLGIDQNLKNERDILGLDLAVYRQYAEELVNVGGYEALVHGLSRAVCLYGGYKEKDGDDQEKGSKERNRHKKNVLTGFKPEIAKLLNEELVKMRSTEKTEQTDNKNSLLYRNAFLSTADGYLSKYLMEPPELTSLVIRDDESEKSDPLIPLSIPNVSASLIHSGLSCLLSLFNSNTVLSSVAISTHLLKIANNWKEIGCKLGSTSTEITDIEISILVFVVLSYCLNVLDTEDGGYIASLESPGPKHAISVSKDLGSNVPSPLTRQHTRSIVCKIRFICLDYTVFVLFYFCGLVFPSGFFCTWGSW